MPGKRTDENLERVALGVHDLLGQNLRGREFTVAYGSLVDTIVDSTFTETLRRSQRRTSAGLSLLAVGTYARQEATTGSDLDLLLVHDRVKSVAPIADALWSAVRDFGFGLDCSVLTPAEAVSAARADVNLAVGLLEARCVAGDTALASHVRERVRRQWAAHPRESLGHLRRAVEQRWAGYGHVGFDPEPNVRLGRGGLLDVEDMRAACVAAPPVAFASSDRRLLAAADELLDVRVALHTVTTGGGDVLTPALHTDVATILELRDSEDLVRIVASAGRRVAWMVDRTWQCIDAGLTRLRGRTRNGSVESGIAVHNEQLDCDLIDAAGTIAFRLAAFSARTGLPISPEGVARLESESTAPPLPWPRSTLDAALDLLGCGHSALPLLESLDQTGVLARCIPEWEDVRNRPWSGGIGLDRHLLDCTAYAARFKRDVHRPDLLLVIALFHKIAGEDERESARRAGTIAHRMGFPDKDIETIAAVIGHRSALVDAVTKRDLTDPTTAQRIAEHVKTTVALELLAALTEAESLSSRRQLPLGEVTRLVRAHIAGDQEDGEPFAPTAEQQNLISRGGVSVTAAGTAIDIIAPDRPGLLALLAGVLALHALPVRTATAARVEGTAVDTFEIDADDLESLDIDGIKADISRFIAGDPEKLNRQLIRRIRSSSVRVRRPARLPVAPVVLVDNDASSKATIVEVRAPDGVALLSRIGGAIAACGCDIEFARALTLGREVVDTFYVVDAATRGRIFDHERIEALTSAITAAL